MLALREAEAKVREADERMQLMIEYAPFIVTLWDEDGQILDCNQEAVRVFGLSSKKEYMDGFFARGPEYQPNGMTTQELFTKARSHIFSETKYTQVEWAHNHGVTGETIPLNVTLVRIKYKDGYAALSYGQDLRERKKMEEETKKAYAEAMKAYAEAEAASEAKSRFVANMNHEMRTPMNVIVGLTELLLDEEDVPVKVKEMLYKINTAGTTLMGLISDVLDISKVDAGKMELTPVHYDVASFLNDIITLNVIRIEEKPIDFELDIHENLPRTLHGDDLRVKQILNNLLSNAFKYTKAGTVTLSVDCKRDGNTVWTSFYVTDTGIGIRAEDVGKLFTDYRQMDIKVNRKIEGTGLGLSITKRFVELLDGEITVESEYGKGTTFKVRIRQEFVTDEPIGKETVESLRSFRYSDRKKQAHRKLVRPDLSYARALVVDDFPTNLDVAAGMLGKYKMQVDCVTSGQESVNLISSGVPVYDVIFMDHMMPGMDGVEAVAAIRALGTEYAKNIPIVALTANAVAGHEKMFLDNGFNAFLPKPFNAVSLDAVVQMWVKQKTKKGVKDEKNY
jgi:PAS domain S-box-containing protein